MKILIVGAKGQLGSALREALKDGETALGSLDKRYADHELFSLDREQMDVGNLAQVMERINGIQPDIIFNCSAMTNVDGCETDAAQALRVNAIGAKNVAMVAQQAGAKLVYVSTDYVFDGMGTKPYEVWDQVNPNTVYGKSKALGESYTLNFCSKAFVVRVAWLYGYYGHNFVKTILKLAQAHETINVVNDQIGNPTNAEDLGHHLLQLALTCEYGIYHCSGKGVCSWYDFAKEIVRLSGSSCNVNPCTTDEFPRPAKRPAYSALSHLAIDMAIEDQMRPWQDALEYFFEHKNEKGDFFS